MLRSLAAIIIVLVAGLSSAIGDTCKPADDHPSAQELVAAFDSHRPRGASAEIRVRLTMTRKGRERRQEFRILENGSDSVLVEFLDPQQKGTRVLSVGNTMWFYSPRTRRAIKIPPIQRVFGDASYGDITQIRLSDDYEPVSEPCLTQLGDKDVLKIVLRAKDTAATYQKIVLWVDAADYLPERMEYYVASGKRLKTAEYPEAKYIDDKLVIGTWRLFNANDKSSVTAIETLSYRQIPIPERQFSRRALESGR